MLLYLNRCLFFILSLISFNVYAKTENCTSSGLAIYKMISGAARGTQYDTLKFILDNYCYDSTYFKNTETLGVNKGGLNPAFWQSEYRTFRLFAREDPNIYTDLNRLDMPLISSVLLSKFLIKKMDTVNDAGKLIFLDQATTFANKPISPFVFYSYKEYQLILADVLNGTKRPLFFHYDKIQGNSLVYALITNSSYAFNFIAPTSKELALKNNTNVKIAHYLFSPIYEVGNPASREYLSIYLSKEEFSLRNINTLYYYDPLSISFYEYAEIMKEYNPELYKSLSERSDFKIREYFKNTENTSNLKESILEKIRFENINTLDQ